MISSVRGQLVEKFPTHVILENNGIGLDILIPVSTFEKINREETVTLLTHLHVREDALILFGFATVEERELFRDLLSVSGIGPKLAIGVLSGSSVEKVYRFIANGDEASLTKIKGLGKKTAQRMILDLTDRAADKIKDAAPQPVPFLPVVNAEAEQSVLAMMSLGYSKKEAESAVARAMTRSSKDATVEELIRIALSGD